jgi:hypothetical protein
MMLPREYTPAQEMIEMRVRVPTRNENAFASFAAFIPQNRHPVSTVLAAKAHDFRQQPGPDMF